MNIEVVNIDWMDMDEADREDIDAIVGWSMEDGPGFLYIYEHLVEEHPWLAPWQEKVVMFLP